MNEVLQAEDAIFMNVQTQLTEPLGIGDGKIHTDIIQEQADQLVREIEAHLRTVAEDAPGSCIDGRNCVGCLDGLTSEVRPSVAGGPLVTAYTAAELVGWFGDNDSATVAERLEKVKAALESHGIVIGAHVDEEAVEVEFVDPKTGQKKTGCGANDKEPEIIEAIYAQNETIRSLASTLLSNDYDPVAMQFVPKAKLGTVLKDWDPVKTLKACTNQTGHTVEVLKAAPTPTHGHKEAIVAFNYNENTSLDRDGFVASTGQQVFCIDMWYIDKLAHALASGSDAKQPYTSLKHAMVAYQAGTYLTLCDGSQRAAIIKAA